MCVSLGTKLAVETRPNGRPIAAVEGGTLTARPVVITTGVTCRRLGVPAPAVRQKALTSPAAGSASRREGRRKIIPAGRHAMAATTRRRGSSLKLQLTQAPAWTPGYWSPKNLRTRADLRARTRKNGSENTT